MATPNLPPIPAPFTVSTPRVSEEDAAKLKAIVTARQTQFDKATVMDIATRAYRMGSESCHRAMAALPLSEDEITTLAAVERRLIERAYQKMNGDVQAAADLLGLGKTTVYRKLKSYGLLRKSRCPNCGADLITSVPRKQ